MASLFFYQYHKSFSAKAVSTLAQSGVCLDWSIFATGLLSCASHLLIPAAQSAIRALFVLLFLSSSTPPPPNSNCWLPGISLLANWNGISFFYGDVVLSADSLQFLPSLVPVEKIVSQTDGS
ncbi:hypothetical protein CHARACLAT_005639 [Characodon lateralis]|uniref:Uncharacterized protein n=1 Tax=Characodon lateralis TaxID=208331 RepID=A0ABU7CNW2_9TELE|nr:hypothetical protein [Characodon lateralis]